ncbi:type IV pilus biogenesis/stability protein PilW [Dyella sp. LX-66]|uniref:type IV pilus biogenesis/stability protein PilW n=1 Tax=unclassified Dyella TaxID=2634549 RepID=UPI001BE09B4B|nr:MULTISPECIES: type IV pilus biogenesis/stability protein PilW [unclassified Dyella]MBT2118441.1 type IV pilus biogenesis/stability protein PilW [Dyella sp. LX-1]MBT2141887.1 type IV pilus biogenesis/stability protein PilW [Dyella sp. LX-66]
MRLDRILLAACLAASLTACQTTGVDPGPNPRVAKSDNALEGARVHTELAQSYMQNGDLQGALTKLNKALSFDPNYVPAHTVMAVLYERIGNQAEAEKHYRRAAALAPDKGDPNNNLGAFLCKTGRAPEAVQYFQKAVADPFYQTPATAWTNAGRCLESTGDAAGAEDDYRKAIALDPQNADALLQVASLLFQHNDAFRARAFLQRYDGLGQVSPAGLKLGHDIELRLGNKDAARNYSRRLQSQFPDSEQARAVDSTASQ